MSRCSNALIYCCWLYWFHSVHLTVHLLVRPACRVRSVARCLFHALTVRIWNRMPTMGEFTYIPINYSKMFKTQWRVCSGNALTHICAVHSGSTHVFVFNKQKKYIFQFCVVGPFMKIHFDNIHENINSTTTPNNKVDTYLRADNRPMQTAVGILALMDYACAKW